MILTIVAIVIFVPIAVVIELGKDDTETLAPAPCGGYLMKKEV